MSGSRGRSCTMVAGRARSLARPLEASLVVLWAVQALSCVSEAPLGPPGANMTGPVTTGTANGDDGSGTDGETGTPSDTSMGCDPLADPVLECGRAMACDLTSGDCVPAEGDRQEDDPCTSTAECLAGLICATGRCRSLCDVEVGVEAGGGCAAGRVCIGADAPIPGLCAEPCELVIDACSVPGDACKRALGPGGVTQAACVSNPGVGLTGDPCLDVSDCAAAHLCSEAAFHTLPCVDEASRCCAPVCDPLELPCFGLEPLCYPLGIPGQESAGFCGTQ